MGTAQNLILDLAKRSRNNQRELSLMTGTGWNDLREEGFDRLDMLKKYVRKSGDQAISIEGVDKHRVH